MFSVLSPAKKLNLSPLDPERSKKLSLTQPALLGQTEQLLETAKKLSPKDVKNLMKLSDSLAQLNYSRFQTFHLPFTPENAKPAILTFDGDTYQGFDADTLSNNDLEYSQNRIGILSGLYGILRPLDLIQAYRLEMGTRLANDRGSNLYKFWGDLIVEQINLSLSKSHCPTLINLASNEYFKSVSPKKVEGTIITPVFKEIRNDTAKVIGFCAKRARGMMARYIVLNKVSNPKELQDFKEAGYEYDQRESSENEWVFSRQS